MILIINEVLFVIEVLFIIGASLMFGSSTDPTETSDIYNELCEVYWKWFLLILMLIIINGGNIEVSLSKQDNTNGINVDYK